MWIEPVAMKEYACAAERAWFGSPQHREAHSHPRLLWHDPPQQLDVSLVTESEVHVRESFAALRGSRRFIDREHLVLQRKL